MVTIINYGLGNINAFCNIYNQLNIEYNIASSSSELIKAKKIILPGVGSFDWAISKLNNSGMRDVLEDLVMKYTIPFLGVCVGMQILANKSSEGVLPGLGWIDADVKSMSEFNNLSCNRLILPHMGWNSLTLKQSNKLFSDVIDPKFYFLHSYFVSPNIEKITVATTKYLKEFTTVINQENVFGVQFHPEKSHKWGIGLLKNFHAEELY